MSKTVKKIATWIIVVLMVLIFVLDIAVVVYGNVLTEKYSVIPESTYIAAEGADRIHFLNTGCSDAILIESNGCFALVDSGEGDNNPRRKTEYTGYSQSVRDYIKKVAMGEDGKAHLEFVLGTHCHYDHIGSFEDIIRDPDIVIERAYFKEYNPEIAHSYESGAWANDETYRAVLAALADREVELIQKPSEEPFVFGDFTVKLYNTVTPAELAGKGENAQSIGVKLIKGEFSAFLAADITKTCGLEKVLGDQIGDIDLLKIGHHGYYGSSSAGFLKKLKPEIAIVTNYLGKIYPNVRWNLSVVAHCPVYSAVNYDGIIATVTDSGSVILTSGMN